LRIYLRFIFYFSKNILGFPTLLLETSSPSAVQPLSSSAPQPPSSSAMLNYSKPSTTPIPQLLQSLNTLQLLQFFPMEIVILLLWDCIYRVNIWWNFFGGGIKRKRRDVLSLLLGMLRRLRLRLSFVLFC
jgi:hypothetical protein